MTLNTSPSRSPATGYDGTDATELLLRSQQLAEAFARDAARRDLERIPPRAEIRALADAGLLAARIPAAYGGPEVPVPEFARILINIARGDANIAQAASPVFANLEKIRIYGTEAQKRHYYGLVLDGALLTGNAAAEKGGKHLGDFSTVIRPDGDGFVLIGAKSYSTGTLYADYTLVTAITEQGGRAAAMVPTDRAGVTIIDDWDGMGQRATASGSAVFDGVRLVASEVIFIPDYGRRRTYEGGFAQLLHSAIDAGIAWAAIEEGMQQARTASRPLPEARVKRGTDDPYVLHTAGRIVIEARAAELLTLRGAEFLDLAIRAFYQGTPEANRLLAEASVAVAEAKYATSEASLHVAEMIYRLGGASATSRAVNLDRHWRNARTHTTHDPVDWKARVVGDYALNGTWPAINTKV
ncbi:dehydrogenase [Sinirhodobacter populi]|uniref:Dehydrogenase n=1 Tax=Paenirhodobacter populi TaxID=2306993 RepID=A0A443K4L8_9RHOB|nr:acyl-CoA dehydrogenase family protein [Sinirhodobacter populi]RWR27706.1 dehydrogenase [Sinirhodobacter populi]